VIGYTTRDIGVVYRALCALAGLALLIPMGFFSGARYANILGACMVIVLLFIEFSTRQKAKGA
jgi:hypothetical protein